MTTMKTTMTRTRKAIAKLTRVVKILGSRPQIAVVALTVLSLILKAVMMVRRIPGPSFISTATRSWSNSVSGIW